MKHSVRRRVISFIMCGVSIMQVSAPLAPSFAMDSHCTFYKHIRPIRPTIFADLWGIEFVKSWEAYWNCNEKFKPNCDNGLFNTLYFALHGTADAARDKLLSPWRRAVKALGYFEKYYRLLDELWRTNKLLAYDPTWEIKGVTDQIYLKEDLFASRFNFGKRKYKKEYLWRFMGRRDSNFWMDYCLMETRALAEYLICVYFALYNVVNKEDLYIARQLQGVIRDCSRDVSKVYDKPDEKIREAFIGVCLKYCHSVVLTVLDRLYKINNKNGADMPIGETWSNEDIEEAEKFLRELRCKDYRNKQGIPKFATGADIKAPVQLIRYVRTKMKDPLYGLCPFEEGGKLFIKDGIEFTTCTALVPYFPAFFPTYMKTIRG